MVSAQDKALANLCVERGLLDADAVARASQAHAAARESGAPPPLARLLVEQRFLAAEVVTRVLAELARASHECVKCRRAVAWEALAALPRYRCDRCGERLEARARPITTSFRGSPGGPVGSGTASLPAVAASVGTTASGPAPAVEPKAPPRAGKPGTSTIGAYEIVREIGRGANGIVYLARRPGLERDFAVKVLLAGLLDKPEAVERFRREAALASRIQHPNVVSVLDVGTAEGGLHFHVMEYCAGRTLKDLIHVEGKRPAQDAALLVAKVARGLAAAHALGVVHRDVKPANVIIDDATGEPRLTDFGLAREATGADLAVTKTGQLVGTPLYMSPEQLKGSRELDGRVDVYALGVVLYELVSGERPFKAETVAHLAAKVLMEKPRPLRELVPGTPRDLDAIVEKALEREPARRYADAAALATELELFLRGEPVSARPRGALEGVARRALVGVALALVAALLGAGGVVAWRVQEGLEEQRAQLVLQQVETLEQQALLGTPQDVLEKLVRDLEARAPRGRARVALDVAWAEVLFRRGRIEEARARAAPRAGEPGLAGARARRVVAGAQVRSGHLDEARPALDALAQASDPALAALADWARLQLVLADPAGTAQPELATRVEQGRDSDAARLLADLAARANDAATEKRLVERALSLAKDDALALLRRATRSRGKLRPSRLRASEEAARADLDAFFALAGPEGERVPEALLLRALASFANRRFAECVRDLDAALDLGLDGVDVHSARGWFPDERGAKSAERAKELDEKRARVATLGRAERLELAALVSPALERRVAAIAARAVETAREPLRLALLASARGDPERDVRALFERAVGSGSRCPVVATEHARFLATRGSGAAADEILRARSLEGANALELLLLEVEWSERRGRRRDAKALAAKLRDAPQAGALAEVGRSIVARLSSELHDAETFARRAIALAPGEAPGHRELANALYARDAVDDSYAAAIAAARLDGRLDPHGVYQGLRAALAAGDDEDALERPGDVRAAWSALVASAPAPAYLCGFAQSFLKGDEAAAYHERALKVDPGSPWGEEGLGNVALDRGDEKEGVKHWRNARRIEPSWRFSRAYVLRLSTDAAREFLSDE